MNGGNFCHKSDCDARFAERDELIQQYSTFNLTDAEGAQGGPPLFSDGWIMTAINEDTNIGICGGISSKKSRDIIMPSAISYASTGSSMVINDVKGEIYDKVSGYIQKCGYRIITLNFRNARRSNRFNPWKRGVMYFKEGNLTKAKAYFMNFAKTVFSSIQSSKDAYWEAVSVDLFVGLILILCKESTCIDQVNVNNLYKLFVQSLQKRGGERLLKKYIEIIKKDADDSVVSMISSLCEGTISAPQDTFQCIYSCFNSAVSKIVFDDDVASMLSGSDFDIEDLGKEKIALFIISPDESSEFNVLLASIIQTIYQELIRCASSQKDFKLERKVVFLLDEFAQMSRLPNINSMFTASRSRNIFFMIAIQSLKQLKMIYKEEGDVIFDNLGVFYYLNSPEFEMNETLSKRCGYYTSEYTKERKRLISPERLAHLDKQRGECLVFAGRNYPYITYLPDIDEYKVDLEGVEIPERKSVELPNFDFDKLMDQMSNDKFDEILKAFSETNKKSKEDDKEKKEEMFYSALDAYFCDNDSLPEDEIENMFKEDFEDDADWLEE